MLSASVGVIAPGQRALLGQPRWYRPGVKPLVVFGHGYTGDATWIQKAGANFNEWKALIEAGFPCISTDLGGAATFGNDTGVNAIDTAIAFAQSRLSPKAGPVHLYLGSMSTLTGLRYAKNNPAKVAAIAVLTPAFDLQYLHDVAPGVSQGGESAAVTLPALVADMEASAGGAANLNTAYYAEHSPVVYASGSTLPMPIHAWTSSNDVLANGPVTSPQMKNKIGAAFDYTVLGPEPGLGHSVADIPTADVVDFFLAHS